MIVLNACSTSLTDHRSLSPFTILEKRASCTNGLK